MTRLALLMAVTVVGALGCGSSTNNVKDGGAGTGDSAAVGGAGGGGGGTTGGVDSAAGGVGGAAGKADGAAGKADGMPGGGVDGAVGDAGTTVGADGGAVDAAADAASGTPDGAAAASMSITSAGGTMMLGEATLTIPAGALSTTTTITVTSSVPADTLPDKSSLVGLVYDFGPSGTTFSKPVALTLPLAMAAPAGKAAVLSWLDVKSNTWMDLPTTVNGNTVTGQTTHFTLFVVRIVAGAANCSFGGGCAGSLGGTWDLSDACIGGDAKDVNDICGAQDTDSYVIGTGGTGTFTVTGDKYVLSMKTSVRAVYSPACLTRTNIANCPAVEAALVKFLMVVPTCTGSAATGCECTFLYTAPDETGTVTADNQLVRENTPANQMQVSDACAKNGALQIRSTTTKIKEAGAPTVQVTVLTGSKK